MKLNKKKNLRKGEEELEILVALDYEVEQFSPYHFRINGRLDIWPSSKKSYDTVAHIKQSYDDLVPFVQHHFSIYETR